MITVGMNYRVLPDKGELFESVFNKVLVVMKEMEGHKESHLFRDTNDPQNYLIVSEWTQRAAFDAFTRSDRFRSVVNWGKEQVLAGRPKHEIYGSDEPVTGQQAPSQCPVGH
ncbi:MAG: antibiotic biosynthesis monooxygenase [Phycisphaerae bacterium]|nr:antibiotic biosynthesis monooxygenase [Phycisphaerae bacterium]